MSLAMRHAFTSTNVREMIAKTTVPWCILLPYATAFATSYWVLADQHQGQHWGLWSACSSSSSSSSSPLPSAVNSSADSSSDEVCRLLSFGDGDALWDAARTLAVLPLLLYLLLLFQMTLMELRAWKGQIGAAVAYLGALFNVLLLVLVGVGYHTDSRWRHRSPTLGGSFWCALPPAPLALLDGLVMSLSAHRRRYPCGKRSPRRLRLKSRSAVRPKARMSSVAPEGTGIPEADREMEMPKKEDERQRERQECAEDLRQQRKFQEHMEELYRQQDRERRLHNLYYD